LRNFFAAFFGAFLIGQGGSESAIDLVSLQQKRYLRLPKEFVRRNRTGAGKDKSFPNGLAQEQKPVRTKGD
jgi:hypothetical protein